MFLIGKVFYYYQVVKALITGKYTYDLGAVQTAVAVHGHYLFINQDRNSGLPKYMVFADNCGHDDGEHC